MRNLAYLLPKHRHTSWNPALEPLEFAGPTGFGYSRRIRLAAAR